MTLVKINGPTGPQEFKMVGSIQAVINRLRVSSPIPNWFWNRLKLNKGKETTYTSPDGDTVTFELELIKIADAASNNQKDRIGKSKP